MGHYIWIGPEGANKDFGLVKRGQIVKINSEEATRFIELGLIKLKEKNKTSTLKEG